MNSDEGLQGRVFRTFRHGARTLTVAAAAYVVLAPVWVLSLRKHWLVATVQGLYESATVGLPIILVFLGALWAFRRRSPWFPWAAALVLGGIHVYATHIEPFRLQVREITIASSKVTRPLRIAHISDIQAAHVGAYEAEALARLAQLEPDLVIHTGDLLQTQALSEVPAELDKLEPMLEAIRAPLGRFHVTGDTDWRIADHYGHFRGLTTLDDKGIVLRHGSDRIRLYGISVRSARHVEETAKRIASWRAHDPDAFNIVFAHPPDFILGLEAEPIDLCLAGHTHGGQIRLPFIGPLFIASRVPRELGRGFHPFGKTWLNTSAGIGAEHARDLPSIRFNCPPEFTIITVLPSTSPRDTR